MTQADIPSPPLPRHRLGGAGLGVSNADEFSIESDEATMEMPPSSTALPTLPDAQPPTA
jgi:hypothetical protein